MKLTCQDVEAHFTPWIDDELDQPTAAAVKAHLAVCEGCRREAALEHAAKSALEGCAARIAPVAPAALRASVRRAIVVPRRRFRLFWVAASAAATVVVTVGLVALTSVFRPVPVFAAQAVVDHLKCMRLGPSTTSSDPHEIESSWREWQGWQLHVPSGQKGAGLKLLGYRRCVITEGRMAHLLYEREGLIVSLFVMPDGPHVAHEELEIFGQDAVLWTSHGHTYALVGRGDRAALAAVASSLEHELETDATPARSGF